MEESIKITNVGEVRDDGMIDIEIEFTDQKFLEEIEKSADSVNMSIEEYIVKALEDYIVKLKEEDEDEKC